MYMFMAKGKWHITHWTWPLDANGKSLNVSHSDLLISCRPIFIFLQEQIAELKSEREEAKGDYERLTENLKSTEDKFVEAKNAISKLEKIVEQQVEIINTEKKAKGKKMIGSRQRGTDEAVTEESEESLQPEVSWQKEYKSSYVFSFIFHQSSEPLIKMSI